VITRSALLALATTLVACSTETLPLDDGGSPDAGPPLDAGEGGADASPHDARPRFDGGSWDAGPCYGDPLNPGPARTLFETTLVVPTRSGQSPVLGDFDGDGRLDLALVHGANAGWMVAVARATGTGGFERLTDVRAVDDSTAVPAAIDLDGDGRAELIIAGQVLALDGQGRWQVRGVVPSLGPYITAVELGGGPPHELIDWGARARIYAADARAVGGLGLVGELDLGPTRSGMARDTNGDGLVDLLSSSGLLALRRSAAPGDFGPALRFPGLEIASLVDTDGDGLAEVIGYLSNSNLTRHALVTYAYDGQQQIVGHSSTESTHAGSVRGIDLDGDTSEDLVSFERGLTLLRAVPGEPGRFVHLGRLLALEYVTYTLVADLTGDGRADLLFLDREGVKLAARTDVALPPSDGRCWLPVGPAPPPLPISSTEGVAYVDDDHPRCGGWAPCFATIAGAIDATTAGTRIVVRSGVYREAVQLTSERVLTSSTSAWIRSMGGGSCVVVGSGVRATIEGFVISDCTNSFQDGYGILVYGDDFDVQIHNNVIRSSPRGGIGVSFSNVGDEGRAIIDGNRIFENGTSGSDDGAGIHIGGPAGPRAEVVITNNIVADNAGAAGVESTDGDLTITIEHNTIVGNRVGVAGLYGPRRGRVRNNIVAGNRRIRDDLLADAGYDPMGAVSFEYNLIGDPAFVGPASNLHGDPLLISGPGGIRRLGPGSPAIDAADPQSTTRTDFEGQPRPQDGDGDGTTRADIGADELCRGCP
jgi:hypothetical protein